MRSKGLNRRDFLGRSSGLVGAAVLPEASRFQGPFRARVQERSTTIRRPERYEDTFIFDRKPFMCGINSIQLFYDGARWWIVSIYWQHESPKHPIPKNYL